MSEELKRRLVEERQKIFTEIKGITDAAEAENRGLTDDEVARFDKGSKDMDELRSRLDRMASIEAMDHQVEESLRKIGVGSEKAPAEDSLEADLRSMLRGDTRGFDLPVVRGAWEYRAVPGPMVTSTAAAAGDLVPTTMYNRIVEHMVQTSGVLQAGPTIIQTTGGENLDVPTTTSYGTALQVGQNASILQDGTANPTVTKRTLSAYKYGQIVQVSRELVDDSAFDIVGFVARATGIAVGLALGGDLAVGNGSSKPAGIVQGATLGKTSATGVTGAFAADDLIDLYFSVIAPYRNSPACAWLMKDASLGAVRKLKDGDGRYLFAPAATVGAPDTLLGKPVYTDPNIAATGIGAKSVLFGDMSAYFVRYAGGARFERSDEFAFDKDLVTFRAIVRSDGVLVDQTGAVKYFVGAAS
jgi:HK97 family phage major capsid protein